MKNSKSMRGFSLIELVIVLAISAIALAWGLPSFIDAIRANNVTSFTNTFIAATNLARTEAIKRNGIAILCPSTDGATCQPVWTGGWLVFADLNADGAPQGDEILRATPKGDNVAMSIPMGGPTRLTFNGRGLAVGLSAMDAQRVITIQAFTCPTGDPLVRNLSFSVTGKVSTTKANCT